MPLKDLKEINTLEFTKYVVANKIDHETAFAWWLTFTLQKRNRIVFKLQNKYWNTTYKFGIEVSTSVKLSYETYDEAGINFWRKSIAKEMLKVKVAYVEKEETPE